jgi:myo-inositol-1(or 4)-monophosphatase
MDDRLFLAIRAAKAGGQRLLRANAHVRGLADQTMISTNTTVLGSKASSAAIATILQEDDPGAFILDRSNVAGHQTKRPDNIWIVDPLSQGTFSTSYRPLCVRIAWVMCNAPVMGVMFFPWRDVLYWGTEIEKLGVWTQDTSENPTACEGRRIRMLRHARQFDRRTHREPFDSILNGDADMAVGPRNVGAVWDIAAGHALVRAAGGLVTDLEGKAINYLDGTTLTCGSIVAIDTELLYPTLETRPFEP